MRTVSELLTHIRKLCAEHTYFSDQLHLAIRSINFENRIRINWMPYISSMETHLFQFTTIRKYDYIDKLELACNGLIIGIDKHLNVFPVYIPSKNLIRKPEILQELSDIPGQDEIYSIKDGSTFGLYYFANRWQFCTRNSINAVSMFWRGYEFAELIERAMNDIDFDKLDHNFCYTFGFKDRSIHLYNDIPNKIWFIQAVNLKTGLVENVDWLNSWKQESLKLTKSEIIGILEKTVDDQNLKKELGFIWKRGNRYYLLETQLWRQIREYIYDPNPGNSSGSGSTGTGHGNSNIDRRDHTNRFADVSFVVMNNYIRGRNLNILFPDLANSTMRFEKILNRVLDLITDKPADPYKNCSSIEDVSTVAISESIQQSLHGKYEITKDSRVFIKNLIMQPTYLNLFYDHLSRIS